MRVLAVIDIFTLAISCPEFLTAKPTADRSCSKQRMLDCESKALDFLHTFNETENTPDLFCENLVNDSDCPLHASEDCKKQYNSASAHYTAFFDTMNLWCNRSSADRKVRFTIGFCSVKHPNEFKKCYKLPRLETKPGQPDCETYIFLNCMLDKVLENCGEEREYLANYIKEYIQPHAHEFCRGCVGIIKNYWILDLLTLFPLVLSFKISN